jgi:hypothetical protein
MWPKVVDSNGHGKQRWDAIRVRAFNHRRLDTKKSEFYIVQLRGAALALKPSAIIAFGGDWRSFDSRFRDWSETA